MVHKGSRVVRECAELSSRWGLPLEFHVAGEPVDMTLFEQRTPRLVTYGRYKRDDLPSMLDGIGVHVAWFPVQWPEAYCYVLSEVMVTGLPVVGAELGALPERLAGRPLSLVEPWDADPEVWLELFLRLYEGRWPSPPALAPYAYPDDFYIEGYWTPKIPSRRNVADP